MVVTWKARWEPGLVFLAPSLFAGTFPPLPQSFTAPVSFTATVKVSGWPEPDRTGHQLGRIKRKRRGALAPPSVQQARLRERRRRMPYV